ncbi:S1C family serine protease [Candidatus Parcubacteria bacterium]|nr:S1C family serine protease [Candidatus Parcubacteria bacterium]
MDDLNKNQLILLALLVSFVTSIATGIVTVSLMEQAPQSVTQTINKVVTQTIEKVVEKTGPATVVRANDDDLIAAAVEKNVSGTVKIRLGEDGDVVGYGAVIGKDGTIVSDVNPAEFAEEAKYFVIMSDGKEFPMTFSKMDKSGVSLWTPVLTGPDGKPAYTPKSLVLGDSDKLRIGQTVLVVSPAGDTLQKGLISGLVRDATTEGSATTTPPVTSVKLVKLSIVLSDDNSGSPLLNLDGDVIGITIYRDGLKVAVPSNVLKESLVAQKPSTS